MPINTISENKTSYSEPYKSPRELVHDLQRQGLVIDNKALAEEILSKISYYRFKLYLFPLKDNTTNQYQGKFNDAIGFYRFDEELRHYLASILSRIEIKFRTYIDQMITPFKDNPFWHRDSSLFTNSLIHEDSLRIIDNEFQRSKESFATNFRDRHSNYPPFWIVAECISFGTVKKIYENLKFSEFYNRPVNKIDELAARFGATTGELKNWMERLRVLRNKCSHHTRIWNSLHQTPRNVLTQVPLSAVPLAQKNSRIYSHLLVMRIMTQHAGIHVNMKDDILTLFNKYPAVKQYYGSMGFPDSWYHSSFWA